jgi:release factor glutamine methyltransferase
VRSSESYGQLLERLQSALDAQPDKPDETAQATLDALWLCTQGSACSAKVAPLMELAPLDTDQLGRLRDLVERRLAGTPLAHLSGVQHFMGLELLAGPDALVPRVETEILARAAMSLADELAPRLVEPRILDVCTGSGNIALVLAKHVPAARVAGCDLSEAAINLARRNADRLRLQDRITFRAGDLLAPFHDGEWVGRVDLLTCNPPYISSAKVPDMAREIADHEPAMAFDGGPFGVSILMRLLQDAPAMLRSGGWLAFEVGLGQGPAMEKRLRGHGQFGTIASFPDRDGRIRALAAQRA